MGLYLPLNVGGWLTSLTVGKFLEKPSTEKIWDFFLFVFGFFLFVFFAKEHVCTRPLFLLLQGIEYKGGSLG